MSIPLFTLPGGIHPPEHKTRSVQTPLTSAPLPPQLYVPVLQHMGAAAKVCVVTGQRVCKGELIAEANGVFSVNVHAPTSGVVREINDYPQAHPSGLSGQCVVIDTDGKDEWTARHPREDFRNIERSALLDIIRNAGIAGLGGAGFPTAVKLNPRSTSPIDTLIINGAECEPYITADDMLMRTRAEDVIAGTLLLGHILHDPARLVIGVEDNKPEAIAALQEAARGTAVEIAVVPTQYPSGGAKQLSWILTGREIPSGHHSADVGVICVNVATAAAAWRAVRFDEPLISRVVTLTGDAIAQPGNVEVALGTPIDFLLTHHGFESAAASRLIVGGPMMGFTLEHTAAPVIKTTNCLIAAGKKELPLPAPAQACIRCGHCADVCPAGLLPQQLFWYAQAGDHDRLKSHHLFDCIECGACSWVCPSSIPLVHHYRAAKGDIRIAEVEKEKADRSRRRFEFRQQRMELEEAAKEAKRAARKLAADEAREKLAEKAAGNVTATPVTTMSDLVATAHEKVATEQAAGVDQQARLERILAAAKNTLEHASKPLEPMVYGEEISPEKLEKQQARIKQAQLKVHEAEKKLAAWLGSQSSDNETAGEKNAPVPDAAAAAILRARERAIASRDTDDEDEQQKRIQALEARLQKTRTLLEQAEEKGAATVPALQKSVLTLEQQLADLRTP